MSPAVDDGGALDPAARAEAYQQAAPAKAEPKIIPTVGRIVHYKMPQWHAEAINQRRKDARDRMDWHIALKSGAQVHGGNEVKAGQLYPAMVVVVWGDTPTSAVNLQVFLDGSDQFWATSITVGEKDGTYQWMDYQKGQAAKTEAAEKTAAMLGAEVRRTGQAGGGY